MSERESTQQNWDMLIRDLSPESQSDIGIKLSTHQTRNYKDLAGKLGLKGNDVDLLARQDPVNPGLQLLREWGVKDGSTARALEHHLRQMGRDDIIRILTRAVCGPLDLVVMIVDEHRKQILSRPVHTFQSEKVKDALQSDSSIAEMLPSLQCCSHSQNIFEHQSGKYHGLQLTFQKIGNTTHTANYTTNVPFPVTHSKTKAVGIIPSEGRQRPEGGYTGHGQSRFRDIHGCNTSPIPYAVQETCSITDRDLGEMNKKVSVHQRVKYFSEPSVSESSITHPKSEYPPSPSPQSAGSPADLSMEPMKPVYDSKSHTTEHTFTSTDSTPMFKIGPTAAASAHHTAVRHLAYPQVQLSATGKHTQQTEKRDAETHVKSVSSNSRVQHPGTYTQDAASFPMMDDVYLTTTFDQCSVSEDDDILGFHADAVNNNIISHIFLPHMDQDGAFIVRPSRDDPSARSISIVFHGEVVNYRIHRRKNFSQSYLTFEYFLYAEGPIFNSIKQLLQHYRTHKIIDEDENDGPSLKLPL